MRYAASSFVTVARFYVERHWRFCEVERGEQMNPREHLAKSVIRHVWTTSREGSVKYLFPALAATSRSPIFHSRILQRSEAWRAITFEGGQPVCSWERPTPRGERRRRRRCRVSDHSTHLRQPASVGRTIHLPTRLCSLILTQSRVWAGNAVLPKIGGS